MKFEFTEECKTGIELIDSEHIQFFAYTNAAFDALEAPDDEAIITAKNIIKKLLDYAETHFEHEEDYMKKHHDAELVRQVHEHQGFRDTIQKMTEKKDLSRDDLKELVNFMGRWLYRHIVTSDTLIGQEHTSGRFIMTKEFLTGIEIVDTEHAKLFEIIGRARDIIEDDYLFDKYDKILGVLNELKDYTYMHFSDEEEYMTKINYDGLSAQKAVHQAFIDRIVNLGLDEMDDLDENQDGFLGEVLDFLTDWLINHILKMDKKIPAK